MEPLPAGQRAMKRPYPVDFLIVMRLPEQLLARTRAHGPSTGLWYVEVVRPSRRRRRLCRQSLLG
jgi:hypothetical protein